MNPASQTRCLNAHRESHETVFHRGKRRPVIASLNPQKGTITLHLKHCRRRKTYSLADLYTGNCSTLQLSLPL